MGIFGLLMIVVAIVLFALIAAAGYAVSRKNGPAHYTEEGSRDVIKTIFHYLVVFATLMMTIGGSVSAFMAIADLVSPSPYYQSFENYKEMVRSGKDPASNASPLPSDEQLQERYDRIVDDEIRMAKTRAVNQLIKSLGWIAIPLPIFLLFQRKIRSNA